MDALAPPLVHVLGFGESAGAVHAWVRDADAVRRVPLHGSFRWELGSTRTCVGRWQDLRHVPCPTAAPVGQEPTCLACSGLENPACVFEPACAADPAACACLATFKGVEHVVYLAFHGILPKVGMTSRRRLPARLREQGADAYFVVQGGLDRAGARATEKAVAFLDRVPEHRSHRETLPQLARPVPWDAIEQRAAAWMRRLGARHAVEGPLCRITDHPVAQPLPGTPHRVRPHGVLAGTWVGAKGNHLLFAETAALRLPMPSPPVAAVPRWDLVGRHARIADAAAAVAAPATAAVA